MLPKSDTHGTQTRPGCPSISSLAGLRVLEGDLENFKAGTSKLEPYSPGLKGGAKVISTRYTFVMLLTSSEHFMLASSAEIISPGVKKSPTLVLKTD